MPGLIHVEHIARHPGASQAPGGEHLVLTVTGSRAAVERRWRATLAPHELLLDLTISDGAAGGPPGTVVLDAAIYPLLPSSVVVDAFEAPRVTAELRRRLDTYAGDAWHYWRGTAIHHAIAESQCWPAQPTRLGREAGTLLGMGRHATRLVRNLPEQIGAPLVIAGRDKAAGRDLLDDVGLPTIEGCVVDDPAAAVRWAATRAPVVLKSLTGGNGDGVIPALTRPADIHTAAARLLGPASPAVLMERFVTGVELRVHVIAGAVAAVRRAVDVTVDADGTSTIAALVEAQRPDVWASTRRVPWLGRRLVGLTWHLGVRREADLFQTVPPRGRLRVGGSDRSEALPHDVLATADRARIDWLFRRYGPASGALDVIVRELGAPLADGGGVLDLNVPCGWAYLGDAVPALAARELETWLPRSFRLEGGRVPLYVAVDLEDLDLDRALQASFARDHPAGVSTTLDPVRGWAPVLDRPEAGALLVRTSSATLAAVGIPRHCRPVVLGGGGAGLSPSVAALAANAGGIVAAWTGGALAHLTPG